MAKIGKERGLIDYLALSDEDRERSGAKPRPIWQYVLRPRVILYTALWGLVGLGLVFALFIRSDVELTVEPDRNPQFVVLADGSVRNGYTVRLLNKTEQTQSFNLAVKGDPALRIQLAGSPYATVQVPPASQLQQRVFIIAPPGADVARFDASDVRIWAQALGGGDRAYKDTVFNGRGGN